MCETVAIRADLCGGGGALRPRSCLVEVALPVLHARVRELDICTRTDSLDFVFSRLEHAESALVQLERLGVAPPALAHDPLLSQKVAIRDCVVGDRLGRTLVGGFRVVIAGRELGDVAERLGDDGDLRGVGAGALGHVQRALVQLDRLDVGRPVLRTPSCEHRVLPGLRVLVGAVIVQREQVGDIGDRFAGQLLEQSADASVDLPSAPEREPLVRNRAKQVVQEAQPTSSLPGGELGQALPVLQVLGVGELFLDDLGEQFELEARPDDGCVPQ